MIEKMTSEQEKLIPAFQEKWRAIALSTEPVDDQTVSSVATAYIASTKEDLGLFFLNSPYAILHLALTDPKNQPWGSPCRINPLEKQLTAQIEKQIKVSLWRRLERRLNYELRPKLESWIWSQVRNQLLQDLLLEDEDFVNFSDLPYISISYSNSTSKACLLDFCISVLGCKTDLAKWQVFESVARDLSGGVFLYKTALIACTRPTLLRFDNEQRLHTEGFPAVQYTDGYSLYSYHGVTLPEEYGKLYPKDWRAQWLLAERNAELRRVLIQVMGYCKIAEELQAEEIDKWQEYSLLKIENEINVETIYLLKMTCPSTGRVHILRVPPDISSTRQAICWVNWGVDPEEFSVQS